MSGSVCDCRRKHDPRRCCSIWFQACGTICQKILQLFWRVAKPDAPKSLVFLVWESPCRLIQACSDVRIASWSCTQSSLGLPPAPVASLFRFVKRIAVGIHFLSKELKNNYSNLSYIYALFSMLLGWQDRFFLTKYYSLEEVAEYSTVYRLADLHGVFVSAFVVAFAPILWSVSNKNKKKSMELFKHIISVSSLLGCLGVCISVIIGPILLPPKYQAALVIIPYLAIGFIFGSFASLYGLILEKNYRVNIRLYSMILGATVNFLLIYFTCLLYTSPSPRDKRQSRMPSSA